MNIYDYSECDEIAEMTDSQRFHLYMVGKEYTFDNVLFYVRNVIFNGEESHTVCDNVAESLYLRFKPK